MAIRGNDVSTEHEFGTGGANARDKPAAQSGGRAGGSKFTGQESESAVRGMMIQDQIRRGFDPTTATQRIEFGRFDTWKEQGDDGDDDDNTRLASLDDNPEDVDPRFNRSRTSVDLIDAYFEVRKSNLLDSVLATITSAFNMAGVAIPVAGLDLEFEIKKAAGILDNLSGSLGEIQSAAAAIAEDEPAVNKQLQKLAKVSLITAAIVTAVSAFAGWRKEGWVSEPHGLGGGWRWRTVLRCERRREDQREAGNHLHRVGQDRQERYAGAPRCLRYQW